MPDNPFIASISASLGRSPGERVPDRPAIIPPKQATPLNEQVDLLISEIAALSGHASRIYRTNISDKLSGLIQKEAINKASLWSNSELEALGIADSLIHLGIELIPSNSDKNALAGCDLGITGADFALAETGTIGLLAGKNKPRAISLLPRVHLVIMHASVLVPDLHPILDAVKRSNYLVLITGPSRTADIELTVTLGVHGPRSLHVWILED